MLIEKVLEKKLLIRNSNHLLTGYPVIRSAGYPVQPYFKLALLVITYTVQDFEINFEFLDPMIWIRIQLDSNDFGVPLINTDPDPDLGSKKSAKIMGNSHQNRQKPPEYHILENR